MNSRGGTVTVESGGKPISFSIEKVWPFTEVPAEGDQKKTKNDKSTPEVASQNDGHNGTHSLPGKFARNNTGSSNPLSSNTELTAPHSKRDTILPFDIGVPRKYLLTKTPQTSSLLCLW